MKEFQWWHHGSGLYHRKTELKECSTSRAQRLSSCEIIKYHRIIDFFWLENTFNRRIIEWFGLYGTFTRPGCSKPSPTYSWWSPRYRATTTSPGNLCQGLSTFTVKNFFLIFNLDLPSFSLNLFPFIIHIDMSVDFPHTGKIMAGGCAILV